MLLVVPSLQNFNHSLFADALPDRFMRLPAEANHISRERLAQASKQR